MNKTAATVSAALVALGGLVALAPPAQAARALAVTTETRAVLLSASHVEVRGSAPASGGPEEGAVGVVLVQPPGSVAQDGGGSTPFSCEAGETVRWAVLVTAGEGAQFSTAEARFSTYANTLLGRRDGLAQRGRQRHPHHRLRVPARDRPRAGEPAVRPPALRLLHQADLHDHQHRFAHP